MSALQEYQEHRFRGQVDTALVKVRQLLDRTRNPVFASEVHHKYSDKFTVAEFLVRYR